MPGTEASADFISAQGAEEQHLPVVPSQKALPPGIRRGGVVYAFMALLHSPI